MKSIIGRLITILLFLILINFSNIYAYDWYEDFDDGDIDWPSGWERHSFDGVIHDGWYSDGRITFVSSSILNDNVCSISCVARIESLDGSKPILYIWGQSHWVDLIAEPYSPTQFRLALFGSSCGKTFKYGTYCIDLILSRSSCSYYVNGKFQGSTESRNSVLRYLIYCAYSDVKFDDVAYNDCACSACPRKALFPELNPDKEVYFPGETAQLTTTVLDEKGNPVTECTITGTVTYPDGTQSNILEWMDNNDGTYTSSLELPQLGHYTVDISVSKEGYKDGEASTEFEVLDAQEIAEAYAPYMYFYEGDIWSIVTGKERYFPITIDLMLDNSTFWKYNDFWDRDRVEEYDNAPNKKEFISSYNSSYYIDVDPPDNNDLLGIGTIDEDKLTPLQKNDRDLYAHVALREYEGKKYIVVQYWFHYIYNDHVNSHEGDWEMIEVLIDLDKFQQNGINTIPEGAAYSRHHTGEYREWDDIEKRDITHPVVYVAEGSHAAYFDKGLFGVQNYFDVVGGSGEPEEPTSVTLIENDPWLDFGGNWGYRSKPEFLGRSGPEGPKYHETKWYHPVEWAFEHEDNPPESILWEYRGMLSIDCPADMYITNSQGQITGTKDGEFIHEIPDSYVNNLGEEERYLVLMDDRYTIEIHGTGEGEFNFSAAFDLWNKSDLWGYTDIPVTPNTIAYSEIDPNMIDYELKIDYNGDGVIDETVTPNLGLSLSSSNAIQPLRLNTTLNYDIEIKNEGDQENTFNLKYELPNGWTGSLSQDVVTLGPKETKTVIFSVDVPDAEIKDYKMRITASSEDGLNAFMTLIASAKPELTVTNLSMVYGEGKEVILSCDASNLGLSDANNVLIRFYNGKPENNNLIGEKTMNLASEETQEVSVSWTTEDGIYNIYTVIDPENTIEESSEYNNTTFNQFIIDRTPPEANIKYNTETEDIEVIGVDNIDEDVDVSYEEYTEKFTVKENDLPKDMEKEFKKRGFRTYRIYTLEDDSGNTLKMKMLYLKLGKVIYTKIVELNYNGEVKTPQKNSFSIVSLYWRGKLKTLVQTLRIDKEFVNVVYNARRDESIITTKEGIERRDGLVLVIVTTEEGYLGYILQ